MQVAWGNYTHADNSVAVRIERDPQRSEGNQYYAFLERWTLAGRLDADDQAALVTAISALEDAYSVENRDLVLMGTNGVAAALRIADTIGGTRIVGGVTYPEDGAADAEFTTFRRFQIVIEALLPTGLAELLAWTESLNFEGTGGPRFGFRQPLVGPPQKQLLAQITPVKVLQQGRAIGFTDYPNPPPPQWPADVHEDQIVIKKSPPKRFGPPGQPKYVEFEIEWSYPHEGLGPFVGDPTPWPV